MTIHSGSTAKLHEMSWANDEPSKRLRLCCWLLLARGWNGMGARILGMNNLKVGMGTRNNRPFFGNEEQCGASNLHNVQ